MRLLKRALAVVSAAVVTVLPLTAFAPAAEAATPPVKITYVRYDSPGSDTGTNTSLVAETVIIKNMTSTPRVITGWTLRDRTGYTYTFPAFTLKGGASVAVHTGKGAASTLHRYFSFTWYVWNNSGDTAYLRNAAGTVVHSCTWSSVGAGYKYC